MPIANWQLSLRRPAHCPFIWGAGVQSPSDPHGAALAGLSRAPRSGADAPRTRPACRSAGPRRWDYCSVHRTGRPPSGPFSGGLVRAGGASRFPHVEYAAPHTPEPQPGAVPLAWLRGRPMAAACVHSLRDVQGGFCPCIPKNLTTWVRPPSFAGMATQHPLSCVWALRCVTLAFCRSQPADTIATSP